MCSQMILKIYDSFIPLLGKGGCEIPAGHHIDIVLTASDRYGCAPDRHPAASSALSDGSHRTPPGFQYGEESVPFLPDVCQSPSSCGSDGHAEHFPHGDNEEDPQETHPLPLCFTAVLQMPSAALLRGQESAALSISGRRDPAWSKVHSAYSWNQYIVKSVVFVTIIIFCSECYHSIIICYTESRRKKNQWKRT